MLTLVFSSKNHSAQRRLFKNKDLKTDGFPESDVFDVTFSKVIFGSAVLKGLNQPRILGPVLTIQFSAGKLAQGTRP